MQRSVRCRGCAATLAGPYCKQCERPSTAARRTLREVLAGQNGRLVHTLKVVLANPGELARELHLSGDPVDACASSRHGRIQAVADSSGRRARRAGYATLTLRRIYAERWVPATLKKIVVVVVGALVHNLALLAASRLRLFRRNR